MALAAAAMLASCAPRTTPPAPVPSPRPVPVEPAPPAVSPPAADWRDGPLTAGDWSYGQRPGPRAEFRAEGPMFVIECTADRRITLFRAGSAATSSTLTIRTTFGERTLAASGGQSSMAATLAPSDPMLDEIAFSRGRFLVRVEGADDLVLPSWPEPARTIEDCRG